MKKAFVISWVWIFVIGFFACTESKKPSEKVEHTTTTENFIDSSVNRSQDSFVNINAYKIPFRSGVAFKLEKLLPLIAQAKTDKDVLVFYDQYNLIEKELNEDLNTEYKKIKNDSIKNLFIDSSNSLAQQLAGQFTINKKDKNIQFGIALDSMIRICKNTKGNHDEAFFQFLKSQQLTSKANISNTLPIYLYKNKNNIKISKLGDFSFINVFRQLNFNRLQYPLFQNYYQYYNELLHEDLMLTKFLNSKDKVLVEYKKILQETKMESFEAERIKQRIEEIESGENNFQFNTTN